MRIVNKSAAPDLSLLTQHCDRGNCPECNEKAGVTYGERISPALNVYSAAPMSHCVKGKKLDTLVECSDPRIVSFYLLVC